MLADFTVLSGDLLTIDPAGTRDLQVRRTVVGGHVPDQSPWAPQGRQESQRRSLSCAG